jgi:hypothetical protein
MLASSTFTGVRVNTARPARQTRAAAVATQAAANPFAGAPLASPAWLWPCLVRRGRSASGAASLGWPRT